VSSRETERNEKRIASVRITRRRNSIWPSPCCTLGMATGKVNQGLSSVSDKSPQEDETWPRMKKIKQKKFRSSLAREQEEINQASISSTWDQMNRAGVTEQRRKSRMRMSCRWRNKGKIENGPNKIQIKIFHEIQQVYIDFTGVTALSHSFD
jgi:hypothetical protein